MLSNQQTPLPPRGTAGTGAPSLYGLRLQDLCPRLFSEVSQAETERARRVALIEQRVRRGEYGVTAPEIIQTVWEGVRYRAW